MFFDSPHPLLCKFENCFLCFFFPIFCLFFSYFDDFYIKNSDPVAGKNLEILEGSKKNSQEYNRSSSFCLSKWTKNWHMVSCPCLLVQLKNMLFRMVITKNGSGQGVLLESTWTYLKYSTHHSVFVKLQFAELQLQLLSHNHLN